MTPLITVDPSTFYASTTAWAAPMFTELLPFLYIVAGIVIALGTIVFIIRVLSDAFHRHDK